MVLEVELAFFQKNLSDWLQHHEGKFALIKGEESAGFFDSDDNALQAGLDQWGVTPFLIKEVLPVDPILYIPALTFGLIHVNP